MNNCDLLLISHPTPYAGISTPLLVWGSSPLSASETTINPTSVTVQLSTPELFGFGGLSRRSENLTIDAPLDAPLTGGAVSGVHLPCTGGGSE